MKKIKLTKEEQWIEDHADEFVPINRKLCGEIITALERKKKDAVLNIRINKHVLESLKAKAQRSGIKYQTFVSEILHKVAQA
jgi:predicted DNA binding CopG/RHH family protein